MLQRGSMFNGYSIEAPDGKVGTVSDMLFDDTTWQLRWLVVDTGGWLTGRNILLHPSSLEKPDTEGRAFPTALTRKAVEASPDIAQDEPVSLQMQRDLTAYYGWDGTSIGGNGIAAALVPPSPHAGVSGGGQQAQHGTTGGNDPHLRSIAEVSTYSIHAIDSNIGHLETFLIDDSDWTIRYLVVDTANWWLGKHVLVAPASVKEIDWRQRFVGLDLTCYKIKGSPSWDGTGVVDRAYEKLLQVYYGWNTLGDALSPTPTGTPSNHPTAPEPARPALETAKV